MNDYNTNLASEYFVLSLLYRNGFDAYITLGNKKAIDILVRNKEKNTTSIDVKGLQGKTSFPIDNVIEEKITYNHFIVFVSFLNKISNFSIIPELYVVPAKWIDKLKYRNPKGNRQVVNLSKLRKHKDLFYYNLELVNGYAKDFFPLSENETNEKWFRFLKVYNGIKSETLNLYDYEQDNVLKFYEFVEIQNKFKERFKVDYINLLTDYFKFFPLANLSSFIDFANQKGFKDYSASASLIKTERLKKGENDINPKNIYFKLGEEINADTREFNSLIPDYTKKQKDYLMKRKK